MGKRARPHLPHARPILPRLRLKQYAAGTTLCDAHDPAGVQDRIPRARPLFRAHDLSGTGDFAPRNPTYPTYPT